MPVQRLLQGLDEVLDGKGVELGPHIREVDVLVRVIAARVEGGVVEVAGAGHTLTTAVPVASSERPAQRLAQLEGWRLDADAKQLAGWREILPVLGRDEKSRSDREMVSKLNDSTNGPIRPRGTRGVIANHGELLAWWKVAADLSAAMAQARASADRNDSFVDKTLSNPGVRKEEGFQVKERPNKRKRDRG